MTPVYIVTADTHDDCYGAEIELFGIYTNEEMAKKRCETLHKNKGYYTKIEKVILNKKCDIYLGGYFE